MINALDIELAKTYESTVEVIREKNWSWLMLSDPHDIGSKQTTHCSLSSAVRNLRRTWWYHRNWLFGIQMSSHWNLPTCRFWGEQILAKRKCTTIWNRKSHGTTTDWNIERQQPTYFRSIGSRLQLDHQRPTSLHCLPGKRHHLD